VFPAQKQIEVFDRDAGLALLAPPGVVCEEGALLCEEAAPASG
jgi:hypothetical protein